MTEAYHYDRDFQAAILRIMVTDPVCLPQFRDILDPRYFGDPDHRTLAQEILSYYDQYRKPPSWVELRAAIADRCRGLDTDDRELLALIGKLEDTEDFDPDFVLSKILRFGQRQEMQISLGKILDLLDEDKDLSEARPILDEALSVGAIQDDGLELYEGMEKLDDLFSESLFHDCIPTGVPALDEALRGGVGGPQLGVLQGAKNVGKSTILVSFGGMALVHLAGSYSGNGMRTGVLHVSFELWEEDIFAMYMSRLTGLKRTLCLEDRDAVREVWSVVKDRVLPGQLRIKYFAPWTLSVDDLRTYISRLKGVYGWVPRMVVIDYADRMNVNRENPYQAYGQLYDGLIKMAYDYGFNIWTATQANRSGYQAEKGRADQVGESWLKVANSDIYIPISQTYQERQVGDARLNVEFLRRGEDGFEVPVRIDYAHSIIKQSGDPTRA